MGGGVIKRQRDAGADGGMDGKQTKRGLVSSASSQEEKFYFSGLEEGR